MENDEKFISSIMRNSLSIVIIVIILFFAQNIHSQKLSGIKTVQKIDSLLQYQKIGRFSRILSDKHPYESFVIYRNKMMDSLAIDSIYLTHMVSSHSDDLLINGYNHINASSLFCYFREKTQLLFERLDTNDPLSHQMNFSKPIKINGKNGIQLFNLQYVFTSKNKYAIQTESINQKLLIFKYDGLIEYNRKPAKNSFDTLQIQYGGIYNEKPYLLKIYPNRKMDFVISRINLSDTILQAVLSVKEYNNVTQILNYINVQKDTLLDAGYTDSDWIETILKLRNGKKIKILDRGMEKSFGLRRFYKTIEKINSKYFTHK